jgi:hypothetical protein
MKDIKRQRKEAFGELGVASAPRALDCGLENGAIGNIFIIH